MTFELGRKLGLSASLILVIVPIFMVFPFGYYIIPLFSTFSLVANYLTGGLYSVAGAPLPSLESIIIPYLALAGIGMIAFITFILGVRWLGRYYKEPDIFKNAIYGMILNLAGVGSASAVIIEVVISATASAKVVGSATIVAPMTGTIPVLLAIMIICCLYTRNN